MKRPDYSAQEFITKKKTEIAQGRTSRLKDIGREGFHQYIVAAITLLEAEDLNEKVFTLERFERIKSTSKSVHGTPPDIQYRIGYYIVGKNGNKDGKWTWGQFAPMISSSDMEKLTQLAKNEGTLL